MIRKIVTFDCFEIFGEYDRVIDKPSEELDTRIQEVKNLINELLNGGLNRSERYQRFKIFYKEYSEMWGMELNPRYY